MTISRAVRLALGGVLSIAIVTLMWSWNSPLTAGHGSVGGYPERIAKPHGEKKLPTRSGPLAAIVEDNNFGNVIYHGVDEWGYAWLLPPSASTPSLNPGGTQFVAVTGDVDPRLTLRDLNSGEVRRFNEVGTDSRGPQDAERAPYRLSQGLALWSPDGSSVAMTTSHGGSRHVPIVVDLQSGEVQELPFRGTVAGWLRDGQIVILKARRVDREVDAVTAVSIDPATGTTTTTPLDPTEPWTENQVGGSVSPQGVLIVCDGNGSRSFSLTSGAQTETPQGLSDSSCPQTWRGEDPVIGTKVYGTPARSVLLTDDGQRSLVAIDPGFQSNAIYWSTDAINGPVHHGLWGTNSARWTWFWREILAFLLFAALAAVIASAVISARRRNKQSGGSDVPGTSNPPD